MTQADKVELARVIISASGAVLLMLILVCTAVFVTLRKPKPRKDETDMAKQAQAANLSAKDIARILAENERLTQDNDRLKQGKGTGALSFKVSEKGACSVYGMGRFPVTLYKEQWARLLDASDALRAFLEANDSKLKAKGDA